VFFFSTAVSLLKLWPELLEVERRKVNEQLSKIMS